MSATVLLFPSRRGAVWIEPAEDGGGCWAVVHERRGQEPYRVATRFAFDRAEAAARELAAQLGADYLGDAAPEPKGAA